MEWPRAASDPPRMPIQTRRQGGTKVDYVDGDGTVIATSKTYWRRNPLYPNPRVTIGRAVFEERLLGKRRNNHMRTPREVVNLETGERIFRIDGLNFDGEARMVFEFGDSRRIHFPVQGTKSDPRMTAVDEADSVLIRWRKIPHHHRIKAGDTEILISSEDRPSVDLLLVMATATPFLSFFFLRPGD